jgi:hypothetical protein
VYLRNNAMVLALMRRATSSIASAWRMQESNIRHANLPGFYEAIGPSIVTLLTTSATKTDFCT